MNLTKRYALMSGKNIFCVLTINSESPLFERMQAAFASGVTGMDVTDILEAQEGWVWDGNKFNPPAEEEYSGN